MSALFLGGVVGFLAVVGLGAVGFGGPGVWLAGAVVGLITAFKLGGSSGSGEPYHIYSGSPRPADCQNADDEYYSTSCANGVCVASRMVTTARGTIREDDMTDEEVRQFERQFDEGYRRPGRTSDWNRSLDMPEEIEFSTKPDWNAAWERAQEKAGFPAPEEWTSDPAEEEY